jgi:hypothetical protein
VTTRRRLLATFVATFAGATLAFILAVLTTRHGSGLVAGHVGSLVAAGLAFLAIGAMLIVAFDRVRTPGLFRVRTESVLWNDRPLFELRTIRDAIAYSNGDRHGVRLKTRWRTAHFEVESAEEADRVVAALGKDSGQAAVSFGGGLGGVFAGLSYFQFWNFSHHWRGCCSARCSSSHPPFTNCSPASAGSSAPTASS